MKTKQQMVDEYHAKYGNPAEFEVYVRIQPEKEWRMIGKTCVTPFLEEPSVKDGMWKCTLKKGWRISQHPESRYALWIDFKEEKVSCK